MTEHEWEVRRVPRPNRAATLWNYHPRSPEVAEYVALEHPQETVAWVLTGHSRVRVARSERKRSGAERKADVKVPSSASDP